jgi:hypothetical protein
MFGKPAPAADEIDRALKAMELIAPHCKTTISRKSYDLFHIVMEAPISQEKKREASRLSLHGAYKQGDSSPPVGDPKDILAFLGDHFSLATNHDQNRYELVQDEPIQDALRALAYTSDPVTINALKGFDPTEPSFVSGICYVYQADKPLELRKAALFFLPLIGDRWFNTRDPIMEPDQMKGFCVNWASAVDDIERTDDVRKAMGDFRKAILAVLFRMINSPHWRPHIVSGKWDLLEHFTSVPDDFQPLKKCIDNPRLIDAIGNVGHPTAMKHWLTILWFKYKGLNTQVREELETVTKEFTQGRRRGDLNACLYAIDSELEKAELASTKYKTFSTDPHAIALGEKVKNLREAKAALRSLM